MKNSICILFLLLIFGIRSNAQNQKGSNPVTKVTETVVFFSQPHFQGQKVRFSVGSIDASRLTFHIRSAKVPSGKVLTIEGTHSDTGVSRCLQFTEDVHDLGISFGPDPEPNRIALCEADLTLCRCN